jgi:cytochrome c2
VWCFVTFQQRKSVAKWSAHSVKISGCAAIAVAILVCRSAYAEGDAAAGKTVFENQCSNCHTTTVGKNGFGPSLAAVTGRRSGGLHGYQYSSAVANAGLTWDATTRDGFLVAAAALRPW